MFVLFSICLAEKSLSRLMTFLILKEIWHLVLRLAQIEKRTATKPQTLESQKLNNLSFFQPSASTQHQSLGSLFGMSDQSQIIKDDHMPLPQVIITRLKCCKSETQRDVQVLKHQPTLLLQNQPNFVADFAFQTNPLMSCSTTKTRSISH